MNLRHYQRLPHTHSHYCPACQLDLTVTQTDATIDTEAKSFECQNNSCPVIYCYCNGRLDNYSITFTEVFRCVEDIISYTDGDAVEVFDPLPQTIDEVGGQVRDHLDDARVELSIEDEIAAEKRFEILARLERALDRRDYSEAYQTKELRERVLEFNGTYIPYSEVLVYTVTTDEFDDNRMIHFPTENATYLGEDDIEPFNPDIAPRLAQYFNINTEEQSVEI